MVFNAPVTRSEAVPLLVFTSLKGVSACFIICQSAEVVILLCSGQYNYTRMVMFDDNVLLKMHSVDV